MERYKIKTLNRTKEKIINVKDTDSVADVDKTKDAINPLLKQAKLQT